MILNEQHQIAFIHVPKCGGTGIRKILMAHDDLDGAFGKRIENDPTLGRADLAHLPLFVLAAEFPDEFERVRRYWSFAILREPTQRFASSLAQRLRMYSDAAIQKQSISRIKDEIAKSIDFIGNRMPDMGHLPLEWAHFQPQVDFVYFNGMLQLDTLYRIDQMNDMYDDLATRIPGLVLPDNRAQPANRSDVHRNDVLRVLVEGTRPVTRKLRSTLPNGLRNYIRHKIYVPQDVRLSKLFQTPDVQDFLSKAYKADFALWKDIGGQ